MAPKATEDAATRSRGGARGARGRRGAGTGVKVRIALFLMIAFGCLLPASAIALPTHAFKETFGSAAQPSFSEAEGMAVDQSTGDLLVIDAGTGTVSRFKPNGEPDPFEALSGNAIDGKAGEADETPQEGLFFGSPLFSQVAVDNSGGETDGNIYVTQSGKHLIDIFGKDGSFLGQLTESSKGALGEPCGVAVDPSGNVYVSDFGEPEGEVHKYEPAGSLPVNGNNSLNFKAPKPSTLAAGAGPSAGSVFVRTGGPIRKFNASSGAEEGKGGEPIVPGPTVTIAVNPATGNLYVAGETEVDEYEVPGSEAIPASKPIDPPGAIWGVAVDEASADVYVTERMAEGSNPNIKVWGPAVPFPEPLTEAASEVGVNEATLNGSLNPDGVPLKPDPEEGCFFEYDTTAYKAGEGPHGEVAPCEEPDAEEVGEGKSPVAVHAKVKGLTPGTAYHFRLVASNANGTAAGEDEALFTPGPTVSAPSASQITASGAKISGQINPRGEETSFQVQYVSDAQFQATEFEEAISVPAFPVELGSGTSEVEVVQPLSGLSPLTTYHFRLVAKSKAAPLAPGPEGAPFTTFPQGSAPLPDERAYELVSPAQKIGEVFVPYTGGDLGSSCGVNCLPGLSAQMMPMQSFPGGEALLYEGQPFSGNLASLANQYLARRAAGGWETESLSSPLFASTGHQGYEGFSEDLGRGVLFQANPVLSGEAPSDKAGVGFANLYLREVNGNLQPLITEPPENRIGGTGVGGNVFKISYGGGNAGTATVAPLSHLVFAANAALTKGVEGIAPPAPEFKIAQQCLEPVEECNLYEWVGGQLRLVNVAPGNKTPVAGAMIGSGRALGLTPSLEAADVDHAVSDDGSRIFFSEAPSGQVYVRENGEKTVEIEHPGTFLTASADGSEVLLDDGCLYSLETKACEDLTKDEGIHKGGFEGILGASEDLSRVYFVDTKILTGENAEEKSPVEEKGKFNLYLFQRGAGTSFIGTLLERDDQKGSNEQIGTWKAARPGRTAQVSPDGRFLAFMSQAQLTNYDNHEAAGERCGKGANPLCPEVYEYDAETGSLACPSCNPSGQPPLARSNLSLILDSSVRAPFRQPANLSAAGEGRIFFESQDVLSPNDTNGMIEDVYEWEPNGVGSCERSSGCVALISSGHSANDSFFLDSSASGDDVFFITRQQLLSRDKDQLLDVYDARVNGGFPEGETAPCAAEACKGPASAPPSLPSAGSSLFAGPGNPPVHHKHRHKKKHKKHKRSASRKRGGSR